MRSPRITLTTLAAALLAGLAPATAGAAGDYGPDTCLEGYVWREARPADHVCVKPAVRDHARADNAAAASRHVAGGTACLTGYVWRSAFGGDLVCVAPPVRKQASADNAAADSRRNSIRASASMYDTHSDCVDYCAAVVVMTWRVRADHVNVGKAIVALYGLKDGKRTAKPAKAWLVPVKAVGTPGGALDFRSGIKPCSGKPNAVFYVQDLASTRWSSALPVRVCKLPA